MWEFDTFIIILLLIIYEMDIKSAIRKISTKQKGGNVKMSEMLKEAIGKHCEVYSSTFAFSKKCIIIDVDNDWVKICEKGDDITKNNIFVRTDTIEYIKVLD